MTISTLTQSETYIETLSINAVEALPGHFSLTIQSQLLSARAPSALHMHHRVIVPREALLDVQAAIGQCLQEQDRGLSAGKHEQKCSRDATTTGCLS